MKSAVDAIRSDMSRHTELIERIIHGRSDANIRFHELCATLRALGFNETVRGSHHVFRHPGIRELINLQRADGNAKVYQVRQIRAILKIYPELRGNLEAP